jgi:hypothetical protein
MNELVTFCPEVMGTDTWTNHRMGSDGERKREGEEVGGETRRMK